MFCDTTLRHEEWTIDGDPKDAQFARLKYKRSEMHELGAGKTAKIDGLSRDELIALGKVISAYLNLETS